MRFYLNIGHNIQNQTNCSNKNITKSLFDVTNRTRVMLDPIMRVTAAHFKFFYTFVNIIHFFRKFSLKASRVVLELFTQFIDLIS